MRGRKETIWRRGIYFTEGLKVSSNITAVQGLYQKQKEKVQARIDNAESGEMETFQLLFGASREPLSLTEHVLS